LNVTTIAGLTGHEAASNNEIRLVLHNMYADGDIKILLSTFSDQDDDTVTDDWIATGISSSSIAYELAQNVRNYWFDGININFDAINGDKFDEFATGEQYIIVLANIINAQLNRNSINPYYIITHTVPSTLFETNAKYPNGGYLMIDEFCDDVISWYNIKFYDSGTHSSENMYKFWLTICCLHHYIQEQQHTTHSTHYL